MKNRIILATLVLSLFTLDSYNQNVGINSDGTSAEAGTMLDVKSAGTTSSSYGLKVKDSEADDKFVVRSDGNVGVGISNPTAGLHVNTDARFGISTFTPVDGNNNNVPIGDQVIIQAGAGPTADFTITGLDNGQEGRVIIFYNHAPFNMTLSNQNSNSDTKNRFGTGTGDIVVANKNAVMLLYLNGRWRPVNN